MSGVNGRPVAPTRAQRTVKVTGIDGVTEVTVRAVGLTVTLLSSAERNRAKRIGQVLEDCVLWKDEPLWTAAEWEAWGGLAENRLMGWELFLAAEQLATPEKKNLPQTSDSPSASAA